MKADGMMNDVELLYLYVYKISSTGTKPKIKNIFVHVTYENK